MYPSLKKSMTPRNPVLLVLFLMLLLQPLTAAAAKTLASEAAAPAEPAHESEFCEVLHRFNSDKKIPDAAVRARFEGEYGAAGDADRRRTWNVETACGEFLVAVPLWADVSPPLLNQQDENRFEDSMGGSWDFEIGGDGKAKGVTQTSQDGTTSEMKRLGDPRSFD